MSKSKIRDKAERLESGEQQATGRCRLIYGDDGDFEVYAIRLADEKHAEWSMRLSYPTAGVWPNGVRKRAQWTADSLMEALQPTLRKIRSVYGGPWVLDIRAARQESYPGDRPTGAKAEAERRILDGPDTPGKRWLQTHKGQSPMVDLKSVPAVAPPKTVATRADIERLKKPKALPEPPHAKLSDEEFFDQEAKECAKAENPQWMEPVASDDPADQWQHGD